MEQTIITKLGRDGTSQRIVAQVAADPGPRPEGTKRFTVFVQYGEGEYASVEEIDVDATNRETAEECAMEELRRHYSPDGKIVSIEERCGWYM